MKAVPKTYKPAELQEVLRILAELDGPFVGAPLVKALHERGYRIVYVGCTKGDLTR